MPNPKIRKIIFDRADIIAGILEGSADVHYGYYHAIKDIRKYLADCRAGKKQRYSTTKADRARRAKTPFTEFGVTFVSYEEAKAVAHRFEKRFGKKEYHDNASEEIKADLTAVLNEVRDAKKKK